MKRLHGLTAAQKLERWAKRKLERRKRAHAARPITLRADHYSRGALERGRRLYPEDTSAERPRTRGECAGGPRPCPFVSCAYHLFIDVGATGGLKLNFPDCEPGDLAESCALDVADRGGSTLEEIAAHMNITRERVRQMEVDLLERLRRNDERMGRQLAEMAPRETRQVRRLPVMGTHKSGEAA